MVLVAAGPGGSVCVAVAPASVLWKIPWTAVPPWMVPGVEGSTRTDRIAPPSGPVADQVAASAGAADRATRVRIRRKVMHVLRMGLRSEIRARSVVDANVFEKTIVQFMNRSSYSRA